jgi:Zn-dependent protease with chaperone function
MQYDFLSLTGNELCGDLLKSSAYAQATKSSNWEDFNKGLRQGLNESLAEPVYQFFQQTGPTKRLNLKDHQIFMNEIKRMAERLDLGYIPDVLLIKDFPGASVAMRKLANAGGIPPSGTIIMNESFVDLFNVRPTLAISPEIKGVMAHELSHLRYDLLPSIGTRLGVKIAPLAGMAGLWLFDKATHRKEKMAEKSIPDYVNMLHGEVRQYAETENHRIDNEEHKKGEWYVDPKWKKLALESGRYLAAAAISYAGMLMLGRHVSLSSEYFADKVAVEIGGNPEAFKNALRTIQQSHREMAKTIPAPTTFKEALKEAYDTLQAMTTHAHPSLPERIAHIDKVAANMMAKASTLPAPI